MRRTNWSKERPLQALWNRWMVADDGGDDVGGGCGPMSTFRSNFVAVSPQTVGRNGKR